MVIHSARPQAAGTTQNNRARTADLLHENRLFVIEVSLGSESGGFEERSGGVVDEVSESESGAA